MGKNDTPRPYEKYGKRLKTELKRQRELFPDSPERYQQKDIANNVLHYTPETASLYFNGKKLLNDDLYKSLAEFWNVRIEYLKCEDDQRTVAELLQFEDEKERKEYQTIEAFLDMLGFEIVPFMYCNVRIKDLYTMWETIKPYAEDVKTIETAMVLYKKYANEYSCSVRFKEGIIPPLEKFPESIISYFKRRSIEPDAVSWNKLQFFALRFNLYHKGVLVGNCSETDIRNCIDDIKGHSGIILGSLNFDTDKLMSDGQLTVSGINDLQHYINLHYTP